MPQPLDPRRLTALLYLKVREAGLTLREVSRRIGKGEDYLARLLKRRRKIDVGTLYAILEVLDLPPSEFFAALKRVGAGEATPPERDPDELLLGTISRGDLFAEIRRVVQEELERRAHPDAPRPSPGSRGDGEEDGDPESTGGGGGPD